MVSKNVYGQTYILQEGTEHGLSCDITLRISWRQHGTWTIIFSICDIPYLYYM